MKSNNKGFISRFIALAMIVTLITGSLGIQQVRAEAATKKTVSSITITTPISSTLTLEKGTSYTLKTKIEPQNAANKKLSFSTSKKSVVSISSKGKLTALKAGTSTITVKATDGSKKKDSIVVTVVNKLVKSTKVTLNTSKAKLYISGNASEAVLQLSAAVSPQNATNKKVNYETSNKKVATVDKNGKVTALSKGTATITAYAADGWGKAAKCVITVAQKDKPTQPPTKAPAEDIKSTVTPVPTKPASNSSGTTAIADKPVSPTVAPPTDTSTTSFKIVDAGKAVSIILDSKAKDYESIKLYAEDFTEDIALVTDVKPSIVNSGTINGNTAIIAGSIGNHEIIDSLIANGKLNVSAIKDKWECYKIQVVEKPTENISKAIVIVGSDRRGTAYGLYHISQDLIGVSPWAFWGDVVPEKQSKIELANTTLNTTSTEPSVKYRGIFLNDEWPSLGTYATNAFGGINEKFYDEVYELILRLKGNYLWPAMWSSEFSLDGSSSPIANAERADKYGVVMGTSHHEPMYRAGNEWGMLNKNYGTNGAWNFFTNANAITKFWEDGVKRNKDFENVITLGMRGEADSALEGTLEENIQNLKNVITAQKKLISDYKLTKEPQVLTIYKEVETFWNGSDTVPGLKSWNVLDDVTIMLTEDNFGNVRTLPTAQTKDREAGWGMYYHFDYHGGPRSYEWINTVPIEKVWEQMSMAYDYGVDEIWIVNVGDLKPMELPISYFLDLAYDFDTWGTNGLNKTKEYTQEWTDQQFPNTLTKAQEEEISEILMDYTKMNGIRKPEIISATTFSQINYDEAQRQLSKVIELENKAKTMYNLMPAATKDTYYQLVYFPAVASANVMKMQIFAGLNQLYYNRGSVLANTYATLVKECINTDTELTNYYNNTMSQGKWKGMMSSAHIGYTAWNDVGWAYPKVSYVEPENGAVMVVDVEGSQQSYRTGTASLPTFNNTEQECYNVNISNAGNKQFDYTVVTNADWIVVDKLQGTVVNSDAIAVSVDWSKVTKDSTGTITLSGAGAQVIVNVIAKVTDISSLSAKTFVEANGIISIEAEHYASNVAKSGVQWKTIDHYGKTLSSIKMFPTTVSFTNQETAPYVEYKVYVASDAQYTLTSYVVPTNNLAMDSRLRYAVAFDDGTATTVDTLPSDFIAGDNGNAPWSNNVMNNIRTTTSTHTLTKGTHTLRFYGLDAGLVLQKLVLSSSALPTSYFGPEESFYVGKAQQQKASVNYLPRKEYVLPGTVSAVGCNEAVVGEVLNAAAGSTYTYPVNIATEGKYTVKLTGSADTTASVNVKIGTTDLGTFNLSATEAVISGSSTVSLPQGSSTMTLSVVSGQAKVKQIALELLDLTPSNPVYLSASSVAANVIPTNAFDKNNDTVWKPNSSDAAPWLEFELDRVCNIDRFNMKGTLGSITGYQVQISTSGGAWQTIYTGTSLITGDDVYVQGTQAYKGDKIRFVFTSFTGEFEISELVLSPYINWALQDTQTKAEVSKATTNAATIIDGDRINPGWITDGTGSYATLTFGSARTIDTINVIGIQESVKNGSAGVIPNATMTSQFVHKTFTVFYMNSAGQWVQSVVYNTDATEANRKVITTIKLAEAVSTTAIKVVVGTSYWIRIIELEPIESYKISAATDLTLASTGSVITKESDGSVISFANSLTITKVDLSLSNTLVAALSTKNSISSFAISEPSVGVAYYKDGAWVTLTADQYDIFENNGGYTVIFVNPIQTSKIKVISTKTITLNHVWGKTGTANTDGIIISDTQCTCNLSQPVITNDAEIIIPSTSTKATISLAALSSISTCSVAGHTTAVSYSYSIEKDQSKIAAISENKLTVSGIGTVIVKVRAIANGISRYNSMTFTVKKSTTNSETYKNWALATNGGTAKVSVGEGTVDGQSITAIIDGDISYTNGQRWRTSTIPAYVELYFNGVKSVNKINLYSQQDSTTLEPTVEMESAIALGKFTVSYLKNGAWVSCSTVTSNKKVWYQLELDTPVETSAIRIDIPELQSGYARLIETEAWGEPKQSETCSCELGVPQITNDTKVSLASGTNTANVTLTGKVFSYTGACTIEGHKAATPALTYSIVSDTNSVASINNNVLSFTGAGTITVKIKASLNGITKTSEKSFTSEAAVPASYKNWALSENSGVITVSKGEGTEEGATVTALNDGNRSFSNSKRWRTNTFPAWVILTMNGQKSIDVINIFGQQTSGALEPTLDMTTTLFLTPMVMQYWNGSTWVDVPGGTFTSSDKVWIQLKLSQPIETNKIRFTFASNSTSWIRVVEVEAYGTSLDTAVCACTLTTPQLMNNATVTLDSKTNTASITLVSAVTSQAITCELPGHASSTPTITYSILSDTNKVASLTGNVVTFTGNGTVTIGVTATMNGLTTTSQKVFTVNSAVVVASINYGLATNGGVVTVSGSAVAQTACNDGNRSYSNGQRYRTDVFPTYVQMELNAPTTVDTINVFTQQNSGNVEPTLDMTTTLKITPMVIEYWNGTAWVTCEGGVISSSNNVWIQLKLAQPIVTTKIRLRFDTKVGDNWLRIIEFEVWGTR